jgi:hypothetical protein
MNITEDDRKDENENESQNINREGSPLELVLVHPIAGSDPFRACPGSLKVACGSLSARFHPLGPGTSPFRAGLFLSRLDLVLEVRDSVPSTLDLIASVHNRSIYGCFWFP